MASFKVRRRLNATGGLAVGPTGGNYADAIHFGQVSASLPELATTETQVGSMLAPGVAEGDLVWLTPASLPSDAQIIAACATAASTITASYYNSGSATISTVDLTISYLAISPS